MPQQDVNGFRLYYEEHGDAGAPPVLLLPGLGEDHRSWLEVSWKLRAHWRVIALDPRDSGLSAKAPGEYTIADIAGDVAAFLAGLGIADAHVAGFSMGGAIAQELAIMHPQRVKKLALIATYDAGDPRGSAIFFQFAHLRRTLSREDYYRTLLPWIYTYRDFESAIIYEDMVRHLATSPYFQDQDAYERQVQAALPFRSRERLVRITQPTLLVFGDEDVLTPLRFARSLEAGIRGSRLAVLSGGGHGLLWTRPTEVGSLLDGFFGEPV